MGTSPIRHGLTRASTHVVKFLLALMEVDLVGRLARWLLVTGPAALGAFVIAWRLAALLGADASTAATVATFVGGATLVPLGAWAERGGSIGHRRTSASRVGDADAGYVFVCYSHDDGDAYVSRLARYLDDEGIPVWFDHEIISGERWRQVIRRKIDSCAAVIVVMTPHAAESRWVAREIAYAEEKGKPIYPLLLSGTRFFDLSDIQHDDVTSGGMPNPALIASLRNTVRLATPLSSDGIGKAIHVGATASAVLHSATITAETAPSTKQTRPLQAASRKQASTTPTPSSWRRAPIVKVGTLVATLVGVTASLPAHTPVLSRVATLTDHNGAYQVTFSPDGKTMAASGADSKVMLWNVVDPAKPVRVATLTITDHPGPVFSVAFNPDGKTMATGGIEGTMMVWNVVDPARPVRVATLTDHSGTVSSIAFSPHGKTMATSSADRTVTVWNVVDPTKPVRVATLADDATSVAFSPDGKAMAIGNIDSRVKVWNVVDPTKPVGLATLTDHGGPVYSAAFSPDGKTMATTSHDKTVRVWNVVDPTKPVRVATLTDHTRSVHWVAFSPDGKTMATASADTTVIVWKLPSHSRA